MSNAITFIEGLLRDVPELKPLYEEHLSDNDELLPHVFLGAVTRFAIDAIASKRSHPSVKQLLDHMDDALRSGNSELVELVGVSFIENLMGEKQALAKLKALMRPRLRQEVEAACGA